MEIATHHTMQVATLMHDGKLKLHIDMKVPLDEIGKGMDEVDTGHACGKVVVTM